MNQFDVVVLGAGSAGEYIANTLARAGKNVALIERLRVGGQCAYLSCMPSKSMLRSAQVRNDAKHLVALGASPHEVDLGSDKLAYDNAAQRRKRITDFLNDAQAAEGVKTAGATLLRGTGIITGANTLRVENETVSWTDLVICTGSSATIPKIAGIETVKYWTSDEALTAAEAPDSMLIVGGGPVACELAQIYARFGSKIVVVEFEGQLAGKEHPKIAGRLRENLLNDGIRVLLKTEVEKVEQLPAGRVSVLLSNGEVLEVDQLVIATGRHPTVANMGLELLDLQMTKKGAIEIDEHCRAVGKQNIWAAGDVVGIAPFTHTASYQGRIIAENILGGKRVADYQAIPRAIYTDPPVASVGIFSSEDESVKVVTAEFDLAQLSRSATDGGSGGHLVLAADAQRRVLIGAAAIGPHADDLIAEAALAIKAEIPLSVLNDVVHAFPTYGEAFHEPIAELVQLTT